MGAAITELQSSLLESDPFLLLLVFIAVLNC
jgi:hypothetical protein